MPRRGEDKTHLNLSLFFHAMSQAPYVSRWSIPSEKKEGVTTMVSGLQPMVNTSLPAQTAPKLVPTTLAQATKATQAQQAQHAQHAQHAQQATLAPLSRKTVAIASLDEFPSLGGPKKAPVSTGNRFAELSKAWAVKQKEDAAVAEEERKKEAKLQSMQMKEKEREEMELRRVGLVAIPSHLFHRKKESSDEEKEVEPNSDEPYSSDEPHEEEEEEEEYTNDGWNNRKHRDDIY